MKLAMTMTDCDGVFFPEIGPAPVPDWYSGPGRFTRSMGVRPTPENRERLRTLRAAELAAWENATRDMVPPTMAAHYAGYAGDITAL